MLAWVVIFPQFFDNLPLRDSMDQSYAFFLSVQFVYLYFAVLCNPLFVSF